MSKIKFRYGYDPQGYSVPAYIRNTINKGDIETNTILYAKHASVTSADIGKLMMVNIAYDNYPPANFNEVHVTAKVTQVPDYDPGAPAQYSFTIERLIEPKMANITISFTCIPTAGETLVLSDNVPSLSKTITYVNGAPAANQVQVDGGATLNDVVGDTILILANDDWAFNGSVFDGGTYTSMTFDLSFGTNKNGFTTDYNIAPTLPACATFTVNSTRTSNTVFTNSDFIKTIPDAFNGATLLVGYNNDTNGAYATMIRIDDVWSVVRGNPNGHAGTAYFSDMIFYDTDADFANGLTWAISNSSPTGTNPIYYLSFSDGFTYIGNGTPTPGSATVYFSDISAPFYNIFGGGNYTVISIFPNNVIPIPPPVTTSIVTVSEGIPITLPLVENLVLGTLVHVDGDYCTIDVSSTLTAKMHSDSIITAPASLENFANQIITFWLFAWKDGEVIDFFGYYSYLQGLGLPGDVVYQVLILSYFTESSYDTLNIGAAGSTVHMRRGTFPIGFFGN